MTDEFQLPNHDITPGTVCELSPQGRAIWQHFLADCSAQAGRPVTGDEVCAALRRVYKDVGTDEPDFHNPTVMQCFLKHLRGPADQ
jgi:hypothetical protein